MFNFFKFIFSWKFIALAVAAFFIGKPALDSLLSDAETEATLQEEALKDDIEGFGWDDIKGIAVKVKDVAGMVKDKIVDILSDAEKDV